MPALGRGRHLDDEEKERVGDLLYAAVLKFHPELAIEITAEMLESYDPEDLHAAINSNAKLKRFSGEVLRRLQSEGSGTVGATNQHSNGHGSVNGHCRSSPNGHRGPNGKEDEVRKRLRDLERERYSLRAELYDAAKWAEDQQREWDAKEQDWKRRLEEASRVQGDPEGKAAKASESGNELHRRAAELEAELKKVREATATAQNAMRETLAATELAKRECAAAAEQEKRGRKEIEIANKWCRDMLESFKQELAAKTEEVELEKAKIEQLRAKAKNAQVDAAAAEQAKAHATALNESKAEISELERKAREVEVEAAKQRRRANELERISKETEANLAVETARKAKDVQSKTDKFIELQSELEIANSELDRCKSQLKQRMEENLVAETLQQAQREARSAKEERGCAEKRLREALAELASIKGTGVAGVAPEMVQKKKATSEPKHEAQPPPLDDEDEDNGEVKPVEAKTTKAKAPPPVCQVDGAEKKKDVSAKVKGKTKKNEKVRSGLRKAATVANEDEERCSAGSLSACGCQAIAVLVGIIALLLPFSFLFQQISPWARSS
eukprot:TRINITY_DN17112_c0_g1_i3.p1 TRINITY_DN17112_c0_g1~~TRINITY_DN17112_c0_g1_i3.p1  ORF type:complete len:605 (-),score=145.44 TRINITY_DN17112_c0_g1_i3:88-1764(-)